MEQMNQTSNTTPVQPMPPKKEGGMSGMIAIIVIIALLAVGGVYYLMTGGAVSEEALPTLEDAQNSDDPAVQATLSQSESDELSSIEADAGATNFADIDAAVSELDSQ